jgi:hypothetical protein
LGITGNPDHSAKGVPFGNSEVGEGGIGVLVGLGVFVGVDVFVG